MKPRDLTLAESDAYDERLAICTVEGISEQARACHRTGAGAAGEAAASAGVRARDDGRCKARAEMRSARRSRDGGRSFSDV